MRKAKKLLKFRDLSDPRAAEAVTNLEAAIRAELLKRDQHYIVERGQVISVDPFTGRPLAGHRLEWGLHKALEAKEGLAPRKTSGMRARMRYYHYLGLYSGLAGIASSAKDVEDKLKEIYGLRVVPIPANWPTTLKVLPEVVYRTRKEKLEAIVQKICRLHEFGQPVLVDASTTQESEELSKLLKRRHVSHRVINAKNPGEEEDAFASAGKTKAITITALSLEGVDIELGEGVASLGGLHVIGSHLHWNKRHDDLVAGRAGRRGNGGAAQFFLSLEDGLFRYSDSSKIAELAGSLGIQEGQAITYEPVHQGILEVQRHAEERRSRTTACLLRYDEIVARQQDAFYAVGDRLLSMKDAARFDYLRSLIDEFAQWLVESVASPDVAPEQWNLQELERTLHTFRIPTQSETLVGQSRSQLLERVRVLLERRLEAQRQHLSTWRGHLSVHILGRRWASYLCLVEDLEAPYTTQLCDQGDSLEKFKLEVVRAFNDLLVQTQNELVSTILGMVVKPRCAI